MAFPGGAPSGENPKRQTPVYQYTNRRIHCQINKKPLHLTQRRKGSAVPLCLVAYDDGPEGARTLDLYNAIVALSQLSYRPVFYNGWDFTTFIVVDQFLPPT